MSEVTFPAEHFHPDNPTDNLWTVVEVCDTTVAWSKYIEVADWLGGWSVRSVHIRTELICIYFSKTLVGYLVLSGLADQSHWWLLYVIQSLTARFDVITVRQTWTERGCPACWETEAVITTNPHLRITLLLKTGRHMSFPRCLVEGLTAGVVFTCEGAAKPNWGGSDPQGGDPPLSTSTLTTLS